MESLSTIYATTAINNKEDAETDGFSSQFVIGTFALVFIIGTSILLFKRRNNG